MGRPWCPRTAPFGQRPGVDRGTGPELIITMLDNAADPKEARPDVPDDHAGVSSDPGAPCDGGSRAPSLYLDGQLIREGRASVRDTPATTQEQSAAASRMRPIYRNPHAIRADPLSL
jgi:hypothetical protein